VTIRIYETASIITFVDITNRIRDLKEHEKLIAEYETLLDTPKVKMQEISRS
jgi:hypothetical protein